MKTASSSRTYYTIYHTICLINSKTYIGKHQTKNLDDGYIGSGKLLRYAIKKYGKENFITETIHIFDHEWQMNLAEKILVVCDKEVSYNLCPGGRGGFGYIVQNGLQNSDKQRTIASLHMQHINKEMRAQRYFSKEAYTACKMKYPNGVWKDRHHSEETKEKMRLSHNPASHPRGPRGPYKKRNHATVAQR